MSGCAKEKSLPTGQANCKAMHMHNRAVKISLRCAHRNDNSQMFVSLITNLFIQHLPLRINRLYKLILLLSSPFFKLFLALNSVFDVRKMFIVNQ